MAADIIAGSWSLEQRPRGPENLIKFRFEGVTSSLVTGDYPVFELKFNEGSKTGSLPFFAISRLWFQIDPGDSNDYDEQQVIQVGPNSAEWEEQSGNLDITYLHEVSAFRGSGSRARGLYSLEQPFYLGRPKQGMEGRFWALTMDTAFASTNNSTIQVYGAGYFSEQPFFGSRDWLH